MMVVSCNQDEQNRAFTGTVQVLVKHRFEERPAQQDVGVPCKPPLSCIIGLIHIVQVKHCDACC